MNNQRAINLLKDLEKSLDDYCELNDEGKTAFGMAITALELFGNSEQLPSIQPELDIWNDGTLHISVSKGQLDKIGRVLVEENGIIFFRLFYQDAEPEHKTGQWIPSDSELEIKCSKCGKDFSEYVDSIDYIYLAEYPKFCPNCGVKMEDGEQNDKLN